MIRLIARTTAKAASANRIAIGEIASQMPSAQAMPFPPLKAEEDGANRADKRGQADPCDSRWRKARGARDNHWNRAFERVANESHHGRTHAARAHHVGRPDIARADGARIEAAKPADDHASGNRADEIRAKYQKSLSDHVCAQTGSPEG